MSIGSFYFKMADGTTRVYNHENKNILAYSKSKEVPETET
jgi:hypothetical protein